MSALHDFGPHPKIPPQDIPPSPTLSMTVPHEPLPPPAFDMISPVMLPLSDIGSPPKIPPQNLSDIPSTPKLRPPPQGPLAASQSASMDQPGHMGQQFSETLEDIPSLPPALSTSEPLVSPTRHLQKFKGTEIEWFYYKSSCKGQILHPKFQSTIPQPLLGDVYIHRDLTEPQPVLKIWQYEADGDENQAWIDVTLRYEGDGDILRHPKYPGYVLQKRNKAGDPSYITANSFHRKLQKQVNPSMKPVETQGPAEEVQNEYSSESSENEHE
jgi:hypothetical protein